MSILDRWDSLNQRLIKIIFFTVAMHSGAYGQVVDGSIRVGQVQPLYNWHWAASKKHGIENRSLINPEDLTVPTGLDWKYVDDSRALTLTGARGETVYMDFLLESRNVDGNVILDITDSNPNIGLGLGVSLKLVTTWYQAGITTRISKNKAYLTHELLLDDDQDVKFDGVWLKDSDGVDWVFQPPEIARLQGVRTLLKKGKKKRLLMIVDIPREMNAGTYNFKVVILKDDQDHTEIASLPVQLTVLPFLLKPIKSTDYKLYLFTGLALDSMPGRPGSYLNANRIAGKYPERKEVFASYIKDIAAHGFNGITLKDWRSPYIDDVLRITKQAGIKDVIVHAASPVVNVQGQSSIRGARFPVINESLIDKIKSMGYQSVFYGYDEVGGNKRLYDQLAMNRKIHEMGGKVINAIFWDDRERVYKAVGEDNSKMFDMMATSMGSHGYKEFFESLPFSYATETNKRNNVKELAYWHPNEENPTTNRIFMGFWLWSSGLSGVIPHGHYFPSHVRKALVEDDLAAGFTRKASPYNDWSFWLPPGNLRHHATVYPAKDGPISTLQWEGVRDGVTDLRYAVMLERLAESPAATPHIRRLAQSLISDIQKEMLGLRGSFINDEQAIRLIKELNRWRAGIQELLLLEHNKEKEL